MLANAYEIETHALITSVALDKSYLSNATVLSKLGLRFLPLDDRRQTFLSSLGDARSISDLIEFGSRWEDESASAQALRHFYDPVFDRPLDVGGSGSSLIAKSPDWALEDNATFLSQSNSYRDARNYFYNALTAATELDRRKSFGLMFQSIGQVIHHLQDMAQPQHVRNDPHCDSPVCQTIDPRFFAPSQYEKYTDLDSPTDRLRQIRVNLPFLEEGSSPVYPGANPATLPLKKPRDFWRTTTPGSSIANGKGISEYTSRNFFSAGTITASYASPQPPTISDWYAPSESVDIRQLLPGTTLQGTVHFHERPVTDSLAGTSDVNKRALSDGLFDGDLAQIYSTTGTSGYLVFALNRFTFDAAHHYLIPRAVAYSSGLINYFFRGQIDVAQPDEGAYAVLDHAIDNQRNGSGFRKLKAKIRNSTPGGTDTSGASIVEPIAERPSAQLIAIVKFHRNNCYQPDLSGEYGSPGIDWRVCRSPVEEIVTSAPAAVPSGVNQDWRPVVFDFSRNVIPINATDIYLQIVYRGPLGEEADGLIVATKDISEPTYNYIFNTWDQYLYCSNGVISSSPPCAQIYTFEQSFCQQAEPQLTLAQCRSRNGRTAKVRGNPIGHRLPGYDPSSPAVPPDEQIYDVAREVPFNALFVLPTPVGNFTRVAILTDVTPSDPYVVVNEVGVGDMTVAFNWSEGTAVPTINQLDVTTDAMVKSRSYAQARGVYVDTTPYVWNPGLSDHFLLSSGTAPSIPPHTIIPSAIIDLAAP
jgi:hypothetical protein